MNYRSYLARLLVPLLHGIRITMKGRG